MEQPRETAGSSEPQAPTHIPPGLSDVRIGRRYTADGIPLVKVDGRQDDNGVPYVRLIRTVQSGFGLGLGIALAQLVLFLILFILFVMLGGPALLFGPTGF